MANKRDNGSGTIYQRPNGSWQARIYIGKKEDGSPKFKYITGKTQTDVKRKIKEYNQSEKIETKKISVSDYIWNWAKVYKLGSIKDSSYDRIEDTIRKHIVPNLGSIQLQELSSDDIQKLINKLKENGYSHSSIKKVYDCLNQVLTHATIKDDILKNPMLLVNMPDKRQFAQKEIRFFNKQESTLIMEEAVRTYNTGRPIYVYGDAYILMLNTGIRMGEAIGLEKHDWDTEKNTLHIRRNVQSVCKRDEDGERLVGRELMYNTTKTYSADRVLPLNKNATEALVRLCAKYPNCPYIIADTHENIVPPERLERTFYYMLKNIGFEKTGVHSLRHTFASTLFAKKVDIKTISKLLGHANIQITLDTYVHLFENIDHDAVAQLDDEF